MKQCIGEGCSKRPSFGVEGTRTLLTCCQCAVAAGHVSLQKKQCIGVGCSTCPNFGVEGTRTMLTCSKCAVAAGHVSLRKDRKRRKLAKRTGAFVVFEAEKSSQQFDDDDDADCVQSVSI